MQTCPSSSNSRFLPRRRRGCSAFGSAVNLLLIEQSLRSFKSDNLGEAPKQELDISSDGNNTSSISGLKRFVNLTDRHVRGISHVRSVSRISIKHGATQQALGLRSLPKIISSKRPVRGQDLQITVLRLDHHTSTLSGVDSYSSLNLYQSL